MKWNGDMHSMSVSQGMEGATGGYDPHPNSTVPYPHPVDMQSEQDRQMSSGMETEMSQQQSWDGTPS